MKTLVIAPHPDDEILEQAGLGLRKAKVKRINFIDYYDRDAIP